LFKLVNMIGCYYKFGGPSVPNKIAIAVKASAIFL
jgi:hypothetical protein